MGKKGRKKPNPQRNDVVIIQPASVDDGIQLPDGNTSSSIGGLTSDGLDTTDILSCVAAGHDPPDATTSLKDQEVDDDCIPVPVIHPLNDLLGFSSCALPPYWYIGRDERSHPPPGGRCEPQPPLLPIASLRPSPSWEVTCKGIAGCSLPPGWTMGAEQKSLPPGRVPPVLASADFTDELEQRSPFMMRRPNESTWSPLAEPEHPIPGVCGFYNLGNTCFMNSVLQCLGHCGLLAAYFLSGAYEHDINVTNPLGHGGQLATQYARLLRKQWSGLYMAIAPREFRMSLAAFCPLLQDMGQHDAQEFLMTLLDGLHEDLNLVVDKPYLTDEMEFDGCDDAVLASYAWRQYQRRNQSFIMDTFQGQLKSTIRCNRCDKVSVTFDPVTFFTLPAQTAIDTYVVIPVLFRSKNYNEPLKRFSCRLLRNAQLIDLQSCLAHMVGLPRECLVLRDIFQSRVWSSLQADETVDIIRPNDEIFAYEIDGIPLAQPEAAGPSEEIPHVIVTFLQYIYDGQWRRAFMPMVFSLRPDLATHELYSYINACLPPPLHCGEDSDDDSAMLYSDEAYSFSLAMASKEGYLMDQFGRPSHDGADLDDTFLTLSALHRRLRNVDVDGITLGLKWKVRPNEQLMCAIVDDISVERNEQWQIQCRSRTELTLDDCWRAFIEEEQLGEDNTWYCPKCKEHRTAFKRLQLFRVPRIMIVHLKRFQFTGNYRRKIDSLVNYPWTGLDLAPYIAQPLPEGQAAVYDLIGITNHLGNSIEFGHYTATVRHANTDQWYSFDDSRTELCDPDDLRPDSSAYLLFYKLRD